MIQIKQAMRRRGLSFKQAINDFLRAGLQKERVRKAVPRFVVRPAPLKHRAGLSFDCTSQLLDDLDGPRR